MNTKGAIPMPAKIKLKMPMSQKQMSGGGMMDGNMAKIMGTASSGKSKRGKKKGK